MSSTMTDTLVTTGTTADPVSTTRNNVESVAEWTDRHENAITAAGAPTGPLITTWNDESCSVETYKGQLSEAEFINRHILDIAAEMENCPPANP